MKFAVAALLAAIVFFTAVVTGVGRERASVEGLPGRVEVLSAPRPGRTPSPPVSPAPSPTVEEVDHEVDELDDSGRGRGRGRGRGHGGDDDEDRSGSNSGSG